MKNIQVFDPPMCCSTGVCGPDVDPALLRLDGFLRQLGSVGVKVERYNLAHQPLLFVQNATIKSLLDLGGVEVLPVVLIDGQVVQKGAYPSSEQYATWMQAAVAGASS